MWATETDNMENNLKPLKRRKGTYTNNMVK